MNKTNIFYCFFSAALLTGNSVPVFGFVPLFSPKAILPSTLESPDVIFQWDGSSPAVSGKSEFKDGMYADYSDHDLMKALIEEAALIWSSVPGTYLNLVIEEVAEGIEFNSDDQINLIATEKTGTLSAAANASPMLNEEEDTIHDCDIRVDPKTGDAEFLLYALVHELGHCLGLGHAHDNYKAIMGYSRTSHQATLGADDKAGVIFLYPHPAYGDPDSKELVNLKCGGIGPVHVTGGRLMLTLVFLLPFSFRRKRLAAKT